MQVKNTHKVFNLFGKKVVDTAKGILKAKGKNADFNKFIGKGR